MIAVAKPQILIPQFHFPAYLKRLKDDVVKQMFHAPMGQGAFVQPLGGEGAEEALGLKTNLIASWEMNEVSGDAIDSHIYGLNLTQNNGVGSAAGVGGVGLSRLFIRDNSSYFLHTSNSLLQTGNINWAGCFWIYRTSNDYHYHVWNKDGEREYVIQFGTTGIAPLAFYVFDGASPVGVVSSSISPVAGAWNFFIFWLSVDDGKVYISANGGAPESSNLSGTPTAGNSPVTIGGIPFDTPMDGRIQSCRFWKNWNPTMQDITNLYNGGMPVPYANL